MTSPISLHFRLAVSYGLIGMSMGMFMAARQDFALATAHAHLNLLGWVSASIYALFFKHYPDAATLPMQWTHLALSHTGVVCMVIGLVFLSHGAFGLGEALAVLGGLATLAGLSTFGVIVFHATRE